MFRLYPLKGLVDGFDLAMYVFDLSRGVELVWFYVLWFLFFCFCCCLFAQVTFFINCKIVRDNLFLFTTFFLFAWFFLVFFFSLKKEGAWSPTLSDLEKKKNGWRFCSKVKKHSKKNFSFSLFLPRWRTGRLFGGVFWSSFFDVRWIPENLKNLIRRIGREVFRSLPVPFRFHRFQTKKTRQKKLEGSFAKRDIHWCW